MTPTAGRSLHDPDVRAVIERARQLRQARAATAPTATARREPDRVPAAVAPARRAGAAPRPRSFNGRVAWVGRAATTIALSCLVLGFGGIVAARLLGLEPLVVRTGSMGATAPIGSLVLTDVIEADDVEQGTVIVLNRSGQSEGVLHRVIGRDDSSGRPVVRTQGDANEVADVDPYVLPERVLSPVLVVPHLGRPIAAATTRLGAFGLILVPATLLLAHRLVVIWSTPAAPKRPAVAPAA